VNAGNAAVPEFNEPRAFAEGLGIREVFGGPQKRKKNRIDTVQIEFGGCQTWKRIEDQNAGRK